MAAIAAITEAMMRITSQGTLPGFMPKPRPRTRTPGAADVANADAAKADTEEDRGVNDHDWRRVMKSILASKTAGAAF